jgi:hypothetical protein
MPRHARERREWRLRVYRGLSSCALMLARKPERKLNLWVLPVANGVRYPLAPRTGAHKLLAIRKFHVSTLGTDQIPFNRGHPVGVGTVWTPTFVPCSPQRVKHTPHARIIGSDTRPAQ